MKIPVLHSKRLIFKPLSLNHLSQEYVSWMNDPDVYRYLESGGDYTLIKLKSFLEDVEKKEIYFWAIHKKENDQHLGNIKINPVHKKHGRAEYGIMMGRKSEWGKGYGKEATMRILTFCFETIQLRKITLGVVSDNKPALNLYEKIGFRTEGIFKKHSLHFDEYCDVTRMAIFREDFSNDG